MHSSGGMGGSGGRGGKGGSGGSGGRLGGIHSRGGRGMHSRLQVERPVPSLCTQPRAEEQLHLPLQVAPAYISMYVCICICMYVCVCVYVYACVYVCVCMHIISSIAHNTIIP
jgi:hypothetical protein